MWMFRACMIKTLMRTKMSVEKYIQLNSTAENFYYLEASVRFQFIFRPSKLKWKGHEGSVFVCIQNYKIVYFLRARFLLFYSWHIDSSLSGPVKVAVCSVNLSLYSVSCFNRTSVWNRVEIGERTLWHYSDRSLLRLIWHLAGKFL